MNFTSYLYSERHTAFAQRVLEEAFPLEERPNFSEIKKRNSDEYHFLVAENNGTMMGIMAYWEFGGVVYIEHFAMDNVLRNRGFGCLVLNCFLDMLPKGIQVVLEAEQPDNPLAKRRIAFYKRHGFVINTHEYLQPPYHSGNGFLPMVMMSRFPLENADFEYITQLLYKNVYGLPNVI